MVKIDDITGEVIEENTENYALAKSELKDLAVFNDWLDKKEALLTAKEQFEMVDVPFRKKIAELFDKYAIKSLKNDYIDIVLKNGYIRKSWDDKKLEAFLYKNGADPDDFKKEKWIDSALQMKYKE